MNVRMSSVVVVSLLAAGHAQSQSDLLGWAQIYAVLGGSTVTSTGPTVVRGELGVWPGTAVVGFPPGVIVDGVLRAADALTHQAQLDASDAYNALALRPITRDLTGIDLGGMTLAAGVFGFASSAGISTVLTLDGAGDPGATFIFRIGSTLTSASASSVRLVNGASACNVFWLVGSSATLGSDSAFAGNLLAQASITLSTHAAIVDGRALALHGAVTMDANAVTAACVPSFCPADFNRDGFVDVFDFTDFVTCFEGGPCPLGRTADVNGDGFVDIYDYSTFVEAFEVGC